MMHITFGDEDAHAEALALGLVKLGPHFVATLCFWCEGKGMRSFEQCSVCGAGKPYGTALGLLINNTPAPESVVNQVLVAASRCVK